jgi:hypothetical protein
MGTSLAEPALGDGRHLFLSNTTQTNEQVELYGERPCALRLQVSFRYEPRPVILSPRMIFGRVLFKAVTQKADVMATLTGAGLRTVRQEKTCCRYGARYSSAWCERRTLGAMIKHRWLGRPARCSTSEISWLLQIRTPFQHSRWTEDTFSRGFCGPDLSP